MLDIPPSMVFKTILTSTSQVPICHPNRVVLNKVLDGTRYSGYAGFPVAREIAGIRKIHYIKMNNIVMHNKKYVIAWCIMYYFFAIMYRQVPIRSRYPMAKSAQQNI